MSDELIVFVTVPSGEDASRIGEALVSERLAACVNVVPGIESIYRWEGKVTRDAEWLLIVKTTGARFEELERRVKALHVYTTPEVIALEISRGSDDYLKWIRESTTPDEVWLEG